MTVYVKSIQRQEGRRGSYLLTLVAKGKIPADWTDSERMVLCRDFGDAVAHAVAAGAET